jgi:hypothetical protein
MKKLVRNMSTDDNRAFWESAQKAAAEVRMWPDWKRAGINVAQVRAEPRPTDLPAPALEKDTLG